MKKIYVFSIILIILQACTYNGQLRDDFHGPKGYTSVAKISEKVAIVQSNTTKHQYFTLTMEHGIAKVDINLYPGLGLSIKKELENIFQNVSLIDYPAQAKIENLIVLPELSSKVLYSNEGKYDIQIQLTLTDLQHLLKNSYVILDG